MRAASPALISALLARVAMWSADLFSISLTNGQTYRWTSADQDISYSGHTWSSVGPSISRSSWASKNTTEIPEMQIQLLSSGTDFGLGNNLKALLTQGLFDGAYIELQRAFMTSFGDTTLGVVMLFGGLAGALEITGLGAKITCTAASVKLTQQLPRRTYQASCSHTLYDQWCTLNRASYLSSYVVASANKISIAWTVAPSDPSVFVFGTMQITSGAGAGQAITVGSAASIGIAFYYPLLIVPSAGDTFTLTQGCDKSVARCLSFGNSENFGGFPYIPNASAGL